MIPRIFHQIWLGPNPLPDDFARYVESWRRHHPDWEHHLWTEETIPPDLHPAVYERLRSPAERSDVFRLELLVRHGGIYVDTDFECLRPLDELIAGVDLFAADAKDGRVNNALIGAAAGHPAMVRGLAEVRPVTRYGVVDKFGTGPFFVDRILKDAGATVFERRLFYPSPVEQDDAYAIHHMARSWKDPAGYRKSLYLANLRLASTRAELASTAFGAWTHLRRREVRQKIEGARRRLSQDVLPRLETVRARLRGRVSRATETLVPRTIHHVWVEPGEIPQDAAARLETWRLHHPGWTQRIWREEDFREPLVRAEGGDPLRTPAERTELLGLELVVRHGGVAVDPSLTCRGRLDGHVSGLRAFAASSEPGVPDPVLFGGEAGHPALVRALEEATPFGWNGYEAGTTGRDALGRALDDGLILLPPSAVRSPRSGARGRVLAVRSRPVDSPEERRRLLEQVVAAEARLAEAESEVERRRAANAGG